MKHNIEGYENMTLEQKLKALEEYEPDMSGFVAKSVFDKTASEAASYKKQLRDKQTDEEARAAKEAEEREKLLARLQELELKEQISNLTAEYVGLGFEKDTATKTATAHANGEFNKVFQNFRALLEARDKAIRAEMLKVTPPPAAGGNGDAPTMTLERLRGMTPQQRFEWQQANPEQYKEIYGGNN